ncbi:MAG: hypothetical protein C0402_14080 [Thermodesulfovibrio sp.]|nr:hypothetical protein [Thermodesulfovibrio sp.]
MNKLYSLSIKSQLFAIVFIMATFAAGIIVYSGISSRNKKITEELAHAAMLAESLAVEHEKVVASAHQLMLTLAQLSEINNHNAAGMQPILTKVLSVNPKYSNIFIADRTGRVLASAIPARDINVADRRYFINALASGHFSSGEFITSRFTDKPVIAFCFPFKDRQGAILGVIVMGIDLSQYRPLLATLALPVGSSYLLLDHKGTIMTRGINPNDFVGQQYDPAGFKRMSGGPEKDTFAAVAHDGIRRFISYRKIRLEGEQTPYMYIRAGIPVAASLAAANRALTWNLSLFAAALCLVVALILLIAKYSIIRRIALLESASRRLAGGDLKVKVTDLVTGGELGRLGLTFDYMAGQIALREEALRESERRYRTLFEQSPDGIVLIDTEGRMVEFNETAHRRLGYSREEFAALSLSQIDSVESPEEIRQNINKIIQKGSAEFVVRHRTKQGEDRDVNIITKVIYLSGRPLMYAIWHDITERKQAEEELIKYRDHLEEVVSERTRELSVLHDQLRQSQKLEAVGLLAGGIAHDFSNILTTIKGSIHIIQKKLTPDSPLIKYVEQVLSSVGRATNLAQSLLAFSRKQTITLKPLSFNEIISSMTKLLSQLIGEHIELNLELTEKKPTIMADRSQIDQVLLNLVTNARDAMPRGGVLIVRTEILDVDEEFINRQGYGVPGRYALLTISDTGTGIDDETKDKIFEPFFTTKELNKGSGLGLAVTYGIVKQHNGYIDIETLAGKGTSFKIYLPAVDIPALQNEHPGRFAVSGKGETILLAEDDAAARKIMAEVMRLSGYAVIEAADGEDAIRIFTEKKDAVDLVLLDVRMPGKDGGEVYEEINKVRQETAVLFISGYTKDIISSQRIIEQGLNFISKAASPEEILTKIREVLDKQGSIS